MLLLGLGGAGCHRHRHAPPDLSASQEPDKVLYEKSLEDIQNKRYDVARLTLQTLLNTYPDSDYLSAAKLAIADSYYEEGTAGALTHAEVEYKDFITFFPNSPEAPYAQYRAAMSHYRQLEKPDRDRTHAKRAEQEFQILLRDYSSSPYAKEGEARLIQVQEVLAEGEYRVGRFYYIRESYRAATSRLANLVERYPNFSRRDESLWMLGQCYSQDLPALAWRADPRIAGGYFSRLVREHPLSPYLEEAKAELGLLGAPIPEPDPVLLARAQTVEPVAVEEEGRPGILGRLFRLTTGKPDVSEAAPWLGPPPLEPPPEVQAPVPSPGRGGSGTAPGAVAVETLEDMPSGTAVETPPGPEGGDASSDPTANQNNEPGSSAENPTGVNPKAKGKKKSLWRKLVPFF